jgi:alpha-galactosidase/6-phospho-beta-glucosidase family protein
VNANVENNGAIYNLAGQKVSESYKGVVIQNGVKMVRK